MSFSKFEDVEGDPNCRKCSGRGWWMHSVVGEITCDATSCYNIRAKRYYEEVRRLGLKCSCHMGKLDHGHAKGLPHTGEDNHWTECEACNNQALKSKYAI